MNTTDFDYIRNYVREEAAIVLEPGKEYLVESRLFSLAQTENLPSVDHLMSEMRQSPDRSLHRKVIDAMTTNETSFFRDIHPFEVLRKYLLPELIARNGARRELAFWCGASSTGQEPYSVLMMIAENFPELFSWDFKFLATDLCSTVLERARAGCFSQLEVNRGLPSSLLLKHFTQQGLNWTIRPELRRRVEFQELNLIKEWPSLPMLDIVFLRNVLIYFDIETKKSILTKIRKRLRPGGYLFLGGAETTYSIDDAFERVPFEQTSCYRLK